MASAALSVHLAQWNKVPDSFIEVIACDGDNLVSGHRDGRIWIYSLNNSASNQELSLKYKAYLIGHKAPVTSLDFLQIENDVEGREQVLLSMSEDGEIMKWSLTDGRCLQSASKSFDGKMSNMVVFPKAEKCSSPRQYIVCSGRSNSVYILDAASLEILRCWTHSNWVSCIPLYESTPNTYTFAISTFDGQLELWSASSNALNASEDLRLISTYSIGSRALSMEASEHDERLVLVISRRTAQVLMISMNRFNEIATVPAPEGQSWCKGDFLSGERIMLWTEAGLATQFDLAEILSHIQSSESFTESTSALAVSTYTHNEGSKGKMCILHKKPSSFMLGLFNAAHTQKFCAWNLLDDITLEASEPQSPEIDVCLTNLWPGELKDHQVTCGIIAGFDYFVRGFESGEIYLVGLSDAFADPSSVDTEHIHKLHGHVGRVTCLFSPRMNTLHEGITWLVSGGHDGLVCLWDLHTFQLIYAYRNHSREILRVLQPPEETGWILQRSVFVIAKDNSISVVSLSDGAYVHCFEGYPHQIRGFKWRSGEDYVCISYEDGQSFEWVYNKEASRFVEYEKTQADAPDSKGLESSVINSNCFREVDMNKKTISLAPIYCGTNGISQITTVSINIKRLISDNYYALPNSAHGSIAKSDTMRTYATQAGTSDYVPDHPADIDFVKSVFASLLTPSVDETFDQLLDAKLIFPRKTMAYGLKGANGNLSILAPQESTDRAKLCISSTLTSSLLLGLMSLVKLILPHKVSSDELSNMIAQFGSGLPDFVGRDYSSPSLSFLAKYWQDTLVDVQQAARSLFISVLHRMSSHEIKSVVEHWESLLPVSITSEKSNIQKMARSAIILGVIGSESPNMLPSRVRKNVALSLTLLLNDDTRISYRLAAIELISRGFSTWEPHLNGSAVLRTLITLLYDPSPTASRLIKVSILRIATANPKLFTSTMITDLLQLKEAKDRNSYLKLISLAVNKKPHILLLYIPRLTEAIIKSLDPRDPKMRKALLKEGTAGLHEIVKTYPSVAFHGDSQKFAVGTNEGVIVIYDLRTATRWQVLEGFTRPVTVISISNDGKYIAGYSREESYIFLWHPSVGFLSMLAETLGSGHSSGNGIGSMLSSHKPSKSFNVVLPADMNLDNITYELAWVSNRCLQLKAGDVTLSFDI
ncbi:WD40 repeat-like protein [Basidiobolus meristosporus CBS 931.73]|uniref:WD40 repeat-like protein n=1 Tax=Basidiobolus meristosporus CBS 931.73 TaxID=1314790 RepID=A0A1Y1Y371_9FUNG|nr:WD40 repeat-like protein [Basidiobolus meristosporus CBS 931.73]|eukprot:ORX92472.1 WD40 repeat-like protein [Basidiobolus meristosporus CBS 931.73]